MHSLTCPARLGTRNGACNCGPAQPPRVKAATLLATILYEGLFQNSGVDPQKFWSGVLSEEQRTKCERAVGAICKADAEDWISQLRERRRPVRAR